MVFKLNNAQKVDTDTLPAYDPYPTAICPKCGNRWKYAGLGRYLECSNCGWYVASKEASKEYQAKYFIKAGNRAKHNKATLEIRTRHISKGLCTTGCGRPIAVNSKSRCIKCLEKHRLEESKKKQ